MYLIKQIDVFNQPLHVKLLDLLISQFLIQIFLDKACIEYLKMEMVDRAESPC